MTGSATDPKCAERKRSERRLLGSIKVQRMAETRLLSSNKYTKTCGQKLKHSGPKGMGMRVGFDRSACGAVKKTGSFYHCGSMDCYDCSMHGRVKVSAKVLEAMRNWCDPDLGRHVVFVGFSVPHRQGDDLPQLLNILDDGVVYACRDDGGHKSRAWKIKWGVEGRILADDWTYGRYGHHPHIAGMFFVDWSGRDVGLSLLGFRDSLLQAYCSRTKSGFSSAELGDKWAYRADVDGIPALFATRAFARAACEEQGQGYESIEPVRLGSRKVLLEAQYVDMPYGKWSVGPDSLDDVRDAIRISDDRSPSWGMRGDLNLAKLARYLCKAATEVAAPHAGIGGGLTPTDLLDIRAGQLSAVKKIEMLCSEPTTPPIITNFHIPMNSSNLARVIWHQYRQGYKKRRIAKTSLRFFEKFGVEQRVPCSECCAKHWLEFDRQKAPQNQVYSPWAPKDCSKCKNRRWYGKETYRPMTDLIDDVSEDADKPKIDWDNAETVLDVEPSVSKGIEDARLMGWLMWFLSKDREGTAELVEILSSVDAAEVHTKWYIGERSPEGEVRNTMQFWERRMVWRLIERWVDVTGLDSPTSWRLMSEEDWGSDTSLPAVEVEPHVSTWWMDEARLQLHIGLKDVEALIGCGCSADFLEALMDLEQGW